MTQKSYREQFIQACRRIAPTVDAKSIEEARSNFIEHFGPDRLAAVSEENILPLLHGVSTEKGLFLILERDKALEYAFGSGRGGFAPKYRVYRSKDGEWVRGSGVNAVVCTDEQAQLISRRVVLGLRAGLEGIDRLQLASGDVTQWELFQESIDNYTLADIFDLDIRADVAVLQLGWAHKYLSIVRPDIISLHHNPAHLAFHLLKLTGNELPSKRYLLDRAWQQFIHETPGLSEFSSTTLMHAAYETFGTPRQYWRVGTREGAEKIDRWPAMSQGSFVSIGWSEIGDISNLLFGTKRQAGIRKLADDFFVEHVSSPGAATNYARQWRDFAIEMNEGDFIVAMDGKKILGIGTVEGPYEFCPDDSLQKHHRPVNWVWTDGPRNWEKHPGYLTTVHNFSSSEASKRLIDSLINNVVPQTPVTVPKEIEGSKTMPPTTLNQILYGPPGTGKTFSTILRAVSIVGGEAVADYAKAKPYWDELRRNGRIGFITFHQSYGYEDFIEGLRPVLDDAGDVPRYEIVDGILKEMAIAALLDSLENIPVDEQSTLLPSLSHLWNVLLEDVERSPKKTYPGATPKTEFCFEVTALGNLQMRNVLNPETRTQSVSRETISSAWHAFASGEYERSELLIATGHYPARKIVFNELKKLAERERGTKDSVHQDNMLPLDAAHEYLLQGTNSGYQIKSNSQPFVLIIDEINRGNISKIFGELITLLEDDKRVGAEHELTVTLPYSRERFGLPSNLHIIGTMNTSDKSISMVDVALRRRFEFEELRPDFSVCKGLSNDMSRALDELNRRIMLRKDRDHRLGHAYFINVSTPEEFGRTFERKVLPLLSEYFYSDWEGLRWVLGDKDDSKGFVRKISGSDDQRNVRNSWQWYLDAENPASPKFELLAILLQNYGISSSVTTSSTTIDDTEA